MTAAPLPARLWTYQAERFPLAAHAPMTLLLCAGSVAAFTGALPVKAVLAGFAALLPLFFIMRVADEHKDHAEDMAFRPERPVPRGLVTLAELRLAGTVAALLPLTLALAFPAALLPLLLAAGWIAAMSVEFGLRDWLREHPVAYLVSHMLVMPLLALLATSFAADIAIPAILPVLALAFGAGLVLEIGRKLWGAEEEREGVETYSRLWGPARAATVWALTAAVTLALAATLAGHPALMALAAAGGGAALTLAFGYAQQPTLARAKRLRAMAAGVIVLAYAVCIAGALIG